MLLASGGKYSVHLWEVATGKSVLKLVAGTNVGAVAFSKDGRRLAASSIPPDTGLGWTYRWALENGAGFRELRGLASPVARVGLSADRKVVAALASDWTLGVWDVREE